MIVDLYLYLLVFLLGRRGYQVRLGPRLHFQVQVPDGKDLHKERLGRHFLRVVLRQYPQQGRVSRKKHRNG